MRASLRPLGLALLAALAFGCGADPSTALHRLGSWAATAAMLGRTWANGATPRAFTTRALDRTAREVGDQERELGALPAPTRTTVTPVIARVVRSTREMSEAVRAGDRGRARALADALTVDARRLQQLAHGDEGS